MKEKIISAALRITGTYPDNRKVQYIIQGITYFDIECSQLFKDVTYSLREYSIGEGFITNTGRFVNQIEAMKIFLKSNEGHRLVDKFTNVPFSVGVNGVKLDKDHDHIVDFNSRDYLKPEDVLKCN